MRRAHVVLSLALAVAWLATGLGLPVPPRAVGNSTGQAPGPVQVPTGLTPSEWQSIQAQVVKLTADDGGADDLFGDSVVVSGDTAIVGARYTAGSGINRQGAAYVFYRDQGGPDAWGQAAKLTAGDGAVGDLFGSSVSFDGDTALVGAQDAAVGGNIYQGAAYVFYRNQGGPDAWGQVAKLTATDGAAHNALGTSVSVSEDTAVVGAGYATIDGQWQQGAAYVFYRNQGSPDAWGQVAKLTAADGAAEDYLGLSVSVSGDTAVGGAPCANVGANPNQGAAYVFYRDQGGPDEWGQVVKLTGTDGVRSDQFGRSVSVSGDTVVAGTPYAKTHSGNEGAAYVFYRDQGGPDAWGQAAKLTAADGARSDQLGVSVSVSGAQAVVGASGVDIGGNERQGATYVFHRDQGGPDAWGQTAKLTAADGAAQDVFGSSVSVSDDTAVVGAGFADVGGLKNQGAAYVYDWTPVAADDGYTTPEDMPLLVPAARGILANDLAPYGTPLTAVLDTGPAHGTLDLHVDGSFVYTPTVNYASLETFTYYANDGVVDSDVATVRILVYTRVFCLPLVVRKG